MIQYIKDNFELTEQQLQWCYTAEWLGLNKTKLKKGLLPDINRFPLYPKEDMLLFHILDYVFEHLKDKTDKVELSYNYDRGFTDVLLNLEDRVLEFNSLEELKGLL